ncbi:dienelactone hydrolase family protein [Phlyctema vagabunda]|uniref:Dienelactone hydrolase family protein n=1 Tax=Phlyctema vagabunda TaxID=108571 RepID=A0ABR4PH13_9HELO
MAGGPCIDCFSGFVHEGTPQGEVSKIHGLDVYVTEPDAGVKPKGLIVIITDAFGMQFVNNKILADRYAKRGGFVVYVPDFMAGRPLPLTANGLTEKLMKRTSWLGMLYKPILLLQALAVALPWLYSSRASVCRPRVISFFQALRSSPAPFPTNDLKVGAAGFCWGGRYAVQLAQDAPSTRVHRNAAGSSSQALLPLVDCAFTAHPSFLKVPQDMEKVTLPLSVTVGDNDMVLKGPHAFLAKEVLEKKKAGDHEVVILPGAKHGFAIRFDPKDQVQMEYAEQAELQAIAWFNRWFST